MPKKDNRTLNYLSFFLYFCFAKRLSYFIFKKGIKTYLFFKLQIKNKTKLKKLNNFIFKFLKTLLFVNKKFNYQLLLNILY
ncbi:hypothetical protein PA0081 [Candidatus Phytoplasma australiense]|uniref:Uncharacterized protein n=1 Tax=Phytoplasma australiense TaxID=59748 RepID=B1V8Y4_PHYAS|nr:hypothetical protein PA0081 [Candidatus Phytoplasma australiense]